MNIGEYSLCRVNIGVLIRERERRDKIVTLLFSINLSTFVDKNDRASQLLKLDHTVKQQNIHSATATLSYVVNIEESSNFSNDY